MIFLKEYGKEVGIKMKRATLFILSVCFLLSFSACAGSMQSLSKGEIYEVAQGVERGRYNKLEQAQQTVALALEYYDQGGYEKSAGLFLEAAELYRGLDARDEQRRSLIAAAKVQLKCSQRQPFLLTMARFKGLIGRLEMPSEEERFLTSRQGDVMLRVLLCCGF